MPGAVDLQHLGDELRRDLAPGGRGAEPRCAKAGIWLNTGEGGTVALSPETGGCDIVFQIGTAKYGVRDAQATSSDDRLRELAAHRSCGCSRSSSPGRQARQGRHPAGGKVDAGDRRDPRHSRGQDSISPNRHPRLRRFRRTARLIGRIREMTGKPVGFKTVSGPPRPAAGCSSDRRRAAPIARRISSPSTGARAAPARRRCR